MWTRVATDRHYRYDDGYQTAGIMPSEDGGLKVWVWPMNLTHVKWIDGRFISVSRAKEAADAWFNQD